MCVCHVTAPHSLPAHFDKQPRDHGGHRKRVPTLNSTSGAATYVTGLLLCSACVCSCAFCMCIAHC